MSTLFLKMVNMSFAASWLVLAILVFRFVFRKTPKWALCLLWALVAVRLICPFSFESKASVLPSAQVITSTNLDTVPYVFETGVESVDIALNYIDNPDFAVHHVPAKYYVPAVEILGYVWLAGFAAMLVYSGISYLRLRRRVSAAVLLEKGIKQSEYVDSPFILGILRPVIYLPYQMEKTDLIHVIAHEKAHLRRYDHLWKPLGFFLLSLHWFNPLMWIAYILLCRDIEAACDEKVIEKMENEDRKAYSYALLHCSVHRRSIAACPLAFGEVGVKQRIKGVMNYKKPVFWAIFMAVAAVVIAGVCFLTNPASSGPYLELIDAKPTEPGFGMSWTYKMDLVKNKEAQEMDLEAYEGILYIERWSKGRYRICEPVMALTSDDKNIQVSTDFEWNAKGEAWMRLTISESLHGKELEMELPFNPDHTTRQYYYPEDFQKISLTDNRNIILCGIAFSGKGGLNPDLDYGNSDWLYQCEDVFLLRLNRQNQVAESTGVVLDIDDYGAVVLMEQEGQMRLHNDQYSVLQIGDHIAVYHDGMVSETFPMEYHACYGVRLIGRGEPLSQDEADVIAEYHMLPGCQIVSKVVITENDEEIVLCFLSHREQDKTYWLSELTTHGWFSSFGVQCPIPEEPELQYLGDGVFTFHYVKEDGSLGTATLERDWDEDRAFVWCNVTME